MEVILKKSVEGLGLPGDVLKVADGYARNYLLPMQLAVHATERNRRHLEHEKRIIDHQEAKDKERAREIAAQITGVTCTLSRRAGENDRLFGSVTPMDIAENLRTQGLIWNGGSLNSLNRFVNSVCLWYPSNCIQMSSSSSVSSLNVKNN